MTPDPLEHLARSISDGNPVDWSETAEKSGSNSPPALDSSLARAVRELARITDFHRELQRTPGPDEPIPHLAAGTPQPGRWGDLTLLERIGAGARGEVWRAWDPTLQREVALKFLTSDTEARKQTSPSPAESPGQTALLNEARALARVHHPGVATVHGIAVHDGRPGMWMELLRGRTLAQEIEERGPLPAEEVARIGMDLSSALEAVHAAGIVHRDIKPANVMLEPDGRVVLTDFGLGLRPARDGNVTRGSDTPIFMAPEVLEGDGATPRTDLYALGLTLWWALAGRPPFHPSSWEELKEQAARGPSTPLGSLRPKPPRRLAGTIEQSMRPSAAERPRNAAELTARLRLARGEIDVTRWRRRFAKIAVPVLGVFLAWVLAAMIGGRIIPGLGTSDPPSVAVLPLVNLSGNPAEDYLTDGMTEELIARLAQVRDLRVIGRSSVMQFKNSKEPLREIARKLRVRTIVEGSVITQGNRVRVSARLVDAPSGRSLWADTYERDMTSVFTVHRDLATAVVRRVESRLTSRERTRLERAAEVNPEAYRLNLQGLAAYRTLTAEGVRNAIVLFRKAAEIDPTYPDAWMGLANAYDFAVAVGLISQQESSAQSVAAARRALELDPESGRARALVAGVEVDHDWNFQAAERKCREALALIPGDAETTEDLVYLLVINGRFDEALHWAKRARDADPASMTAAAISLLPLMEAKRYDEAVRTARDILVTYPDAPWILLVMGECQFHSGRHDEGIATIQRSVRLDPTPPAIGFLGFAYGRVGKPERARAMLAELARIQQRSYVDPYHFAIVHLGLGDTSRALDGIDEAARTRSPEAKFLRIDPTVDPLRAHPRFRTTLKRLYAS